jgi:hypothetical protein
MIISAVKHYFSSTYLPSTRLVTFLAASNFEAIIFTNIIKNLVERVVFSKM